MLLLLDPILQRYGPSADNHLLHLSDQKENQHETICTKEHHLVIAVILGVLGFLGNFMALPVIGGLSFWLLFLGFALLAVATMIDGL